MAIGAATHLRKMATNTKDASSGIDLHRTQRHRSDMSWPAGGWDVTRGAMQQLGLEWPAGEELEREVAEAAQSEPEPGDEEGSEAAAVGVGGVLRDVVAPLLRGHRDGERVLAAFDSALPGATLSGTVDDPKLGLPKLGDLATKALKDKVRKDDNGNNFWERELDGSSPGPIFSTSVYAMILAMPYHYIPLYQR